MMNISFGIESEPVGGRVMKKIGVLHSQPGLNFLMIMRKRRETMPTMDIDKSVV